MNGIIHMFVYFLDDLIRVCQAEIYLASEDICHHVKSQHSLSMEVPNKLMGTNLYSYLIDLNSISCYSFWKESCLLTVIKMPLTIRYKYRIYIKAVDYMISVIIIILIILGLHN